jgi:HK97 family phage prohead protease/HK97 family phage major capsid protein
MIERVTIDGRSGSACFIDSKFTPVAEAQASFFKIVFDDGGQLILDARQGAPPPPRKQTKVEGRQAMPVPKPHKGESQSDYMARCVPEAITAADGTKRPQDQAVAICFQGWRDRNKQLDDDVPMPDDDEGQDDFLDRCVDQLTDGGNYQIDEDAAMEACQLAWEDRSVHGIRHKTHAGEIAGMEFVLSDESIDRMGDVIAADGWDLTNFNKNPVALFSHRSDFPIGVWRNLRSDGKALRGHLELAPEGTSPRIDEIRKLIDAGILKAVSVGFKPIKSVERKDDEGRWLGQHFLKQELVETSVVAVPANPNALVVAKSLKISPETLTLIFAKHGNRNELQRRGFAGKHAANPHNGKGRAMSSLAQRITDTETTLVDRRDKLAEHWQHVDNSNVSDAELENAAKLNAEIAHFEKQLASLADSEKLLAKTTGNGQGRALAPYVAGGDDSPVSITAPAVISKRKKDLDVLDYIVHAGAVAYAAKAWNRSVDETRMKIYGDDENHKVACDLILRAASAPAMTTVTGWAAELVQQTYTDLMPLLFPQAILTRLAGRGLALSFGRAGRIIIPTRSRTPTIAGSFVGEGLAIPVRQGAFTTQTLVPKKLAVISVWTKEMDDHSIPAIEGLIREAIQQDTSVAIDTVLLDANPATVIRPAGLLNGVAATTATAGGGLAALIGDIKALISALTTSTYGNLRSPVWLMNPSDVLSATLASAVNTGIFPFRDEVRGGALNTIPIIDSATVPAKTMILIDAADFVVAGGEAPRLEISDQATLHMEDTAPADLVGPGSPGVVASPQRSLFQTDSLALRMLLPLNWLQRRAGTVAWTSSVTWS